MCYLSLSKQLWSQLAEPVDYQRNRTQGASDEASGSSSSNTTSNSSSSSSSSSSNNQRTNSTMGSNPLRLHHFGPRGPSTFTVQRMGSRDQRGDPAADMIAWVFWGIEWLWGFVRNFLDFRIFYKSPFASKFSWKKRSSVYRVQTSSLGMWRVCISSKIHPGGSWGLLYLSNHILDVVGGG